nr:immunoglobulin heavy chain junction region [Mus musculus]MBK4184893.1 immunoglobulin heavy chain junction region [Mus musculus]
CARYIQLIWYFDVW